MTEEQKAFLEGTDFMRLGHQISSGQWNLAMLSLRRMQKRCAEVGLTEFTGLFAGIGAACRGRQREEALQIMTQVTARRVRLRKQLQQEGTSLSQGEDSV